MVRRWLEMENITLGLWPYRFYQRLLEKNLHRLHVRLEYSPPGVAILDYLDTYTAIWSISEFTTKWIWRYWKRNSEYFVSSCQCGKLTQAARSARRF